MGKLGALSNLQNTYKMINEIGISTIWLTQK